MIVPIRLASPVVLPVSPVISHGNLRAALANTSRQVLHIWRKKRGFPNTHRSGKDAFFVVSDVVTWLRGQGIEVIRQDQ